MRLAILIITAIFLNFGLIAQSPWVSVRESEIPEVSRQGREIVPQKSAFYKLDAGLLQAITSAAPSEEQYIRDRKGLSISLPQPDNSIKEYLIWQAPVMESELAAKYPSIRSFKGYRAGNPDEVVRFTYGPTGFHGVILSSDSQIYIDPFVEGRDTYYQVYDTDDHRDFAVSGRPFCGTDDKWLEELRHTTGIENRVLGDKIELRKYRLALGCSGEWGALRGTVEKALAEMVTFVERANIVFEKELAFTLQLIDKNDQLIFLDGTTDPYNNPNQGLSLVGQNTNILNGRVGFASYDVGHMFSICYDVGGVAGGQVCTQGKGAGVTCHNGTAVSTGIVLVFNHEVGHQMSASHTFNHCGDTDQLALGTAYEPGSGSTIMAYPGACGADNLGAPRDDYYHVASLEQMLSYSNSESADAYECAEKVDIGNYLPVITMPYKSGFHIPKSTPFFLSASATDNNGDNLTYTWEQFDNQTSSPLGSPTGDAPLFRSLKPGTSPTRYFPAVSRILNGQFTDKTELLPSYGRGMTFRFVVRDNNPLGNAAVWDEVKFRVAENAGPFRLTYPVLDYKWKIGDKINVTWDVAGTDLAPVTCSSVDVYMAFNNSLDFNTENMVLLAKSVPNDGEQTVIVPDKISIRARIVVKATDNIFLTTGTYNSRIDVPEVPSFYMDINDAAREVCLPATEQFEISTKSFAGLQDKIRFEVAGGLPQDVSAVFVADSITPGEPNRLTFNFPNTTPSGNYEVVVRALVPGVDTLERIVRLILVRTQLDTPGLVEPQDGLSNAGPTQKYIWEKKDDASGYLIEVATSPGFGQGDIVISQEVANNSFNSNVFLEKATIYYWRVRAFNGCRNGEWSETYAFNTEALNCTVIKSGQLSLNISPSGMPMVESILNVFNEGIISDVNVKDISGDHQWVGDLTAYLVAPSGKEVLLWSRKCGSSKGFKVGLDDQSNQFFQCPINTGKIYRPEVKLSAFNGENMKGTWKLRLEDKASGNGGRLTNFDLELCSSIALNPPVLIRNEVMQLHPKNSKAVENTLLLAQDDNNSAQELQYILVAAPTRGTLTVNGAPALAGMSFTQADIDQNKILYYHTADDEENDGFSFVVSDGQGGWISITEFVIDIDSAFPSSVNVTASGFEILVYPNPAGDLVYIRLADGKILNKVTVTDLTGKTLDASEGPSAEHVFEVAGYPAGIYLARIEDGDRVLVRRFVKK